MAEETVDFEELQTSLAQYQEQIQQVEQLLLDDPDNEEYKNIHESLSEVIQLTKDVLTDAPVEEEEVIGGEEEEEQQQQQPSSTLHPPPPSTSTLPTHVAKQIKIAQQRAALSGQGPLSWAIGAPVAAIYPDNPNDDNNGQWHKARITGINASNGNYRVVFEGYANQEEVEINPADRGRVIKFREGGGDGDGGRGGDGGDGLLSSGGEAVYQPIAAPKRNKVEELGGGKKGGGGGGKKSVDVVVGYSSYGSAGPSAVAAAATTVGVGVEETMPSWMEILPTDDDKTAAKKKKLQKSWKSKQRFHKMDVETQTKADSWKNFVAKKGTKRKKGTMTAVNKESMFAVPEKGVGVLGGRGITEYAKPKRHNFTNGGG